MKTKSSQASAQPLPSKFPIALRKHFNHFQKKGFQNLSSGLSLNLSQRSLPNTPAKELLSVSDTPQHVQLSADDAATLLHTTFRLPSPSLGSCGCLTVIPPDTAPIHRVDHRLKGKDCQVLSIFLLLDPNAQQWFNKCKMNGLEFLPRAHYASRFQLPSAHELPHTDRQT